MIQGTPPMYIEERYYLHKQPPGISIGQEFERFGFMYEVTDFNIEIEINYIFIKLQIL